MRISRALAAVAVAAITAGGAFVASAPATATEPVEGVCVPAAASTETVVVTEAWVQTIEHPAVGPETIPNPDHQPGTAPVGEPTIPNPDYQPPRTETVVVTPAVPEVPEESHTDYTYEKHVWALTWVGTGKTSVHHNDKGDYYAQGVVRWIKVGETKHVTREYAPPVDAVTEERQYPAVGEPTIPNPDYVPGRDAVGEPTIPNPDYVAPRTERIEHPAVTREVKHEAVTCADDVALTVTARCYDGQAGIAVRVDNGTGAALTVRSGPGSAVTWPAAEVAAGASFYQAFLSGADAVADGRVVVALRNDGGAWTRTARYTAVECETSAPPVEPEPGPAPEPSSAPPVPPVTGSAPAPVTVQQVVAPQPQDDVEAAENGETYSALASTGANPAALVVTALVVLALGWIIVVMARRRA